MGTTPPIERYISFLLKVEFLFVHLLHYLLIYIQLFNYKCIAILRMHFPSKPKLGY